MIRIAYEEIFPHVDYEFELADIGTGVANKMSNFTFRSPS